MAVNLSPVGGVAAQFFTSTGAVLTGGKLYTYAAGTTTPATTYTTSQGNVAWSNPIVLDAAGRVSGSGEIWLLDGAIYKFVLKDSNDVLIATYDNITGINSNAVAYTNQQEIVTATAGQTVFNLGISYQPGTNSLSVFVDGVNQYGPGAQYAYTETDGNTVTFNSGLHVGAEVKFTTTQQQGAGAVDASQVTYDPPFTGSVATNVEAKLAQTVSVKDFGADSTGVTGASAAIQAAIDAAAALGGGGIYIPAGTYLIDANIELKSNVSIYGVGPASVLSFTGNNRQCFYGTNINQVKIHDLFFNGNKPNVGWETPDNYDFGVRLGTDASAQDVSYVEVYNCTFKDIGLDGVYAENFFNVAIYDNNFINCRRWGVVILGGVYNSNFVNIYDNFFNCDYGTGPLGKEYPLGAVDVEPYRTGEQINHITLKNLTGVRNRTQVYNATDSFDNVQNASIEGCIVVNEVLGANNCQCNIVNCQISGDTLGQLRLDSDADFIKTTSYDLNVTINRPRDPRENSGRYNLLPCDFGDPQYYNLGPTISGTGQSNGYFLKYLDGAYVWCQEIQIGAGTGIYRSLKQTLSATINAGDQVYLFLEVERTDANSPTNNYMTVFIGNDFSRLMNIPTGVNQLSFAYTATNTEVNPEFGVGLGGNPGAVVKVIFRKLFLLVNPKRIDNTLYTVTVNTLPKNITYTGPSLDAYNLAQANLTIASAQNLDTINGGYPGARLSLFSMSSSDSVTVRDTTVSTGNIRLINGSTQTLRNGTSTQAISFVYNSDGYWYQTT